MNSGADTSETRPSSALSPGGHRGTLSRDENQDTPGINVFSVFSRPALSLLQKYLPGSLQTRSLTDSIPEWVSEDLTPGQEVAYLRKLGDMMPLSERSQHGVGRPLQPRSEGNLAWMTEEALSELGIKGGGDHEHIKFSFSSAGNRGHVLLNATSSTEATSSLLQSDWRRYTWWGGFWGTDDGPQSWLSKLSLGRGEGVSAAHCSPPPDGTKAAVAQTTALFVPFSSWESMASENAGHSRNTQQPVDNGSLESPQPGTLKCSEVLPQGPNISTGAAAGFSEVAVLTPDQDNGYSSLEEGHGLCQPQPIKACSAEDLQLEGNIAVVETESSEPTEGPSQAAERMEEEGAEDEACDVGGSKEDGGGDTPPQEGSSAAAAMLTSPYCQNRAIAFIMGSPCSDDDDDDDDDADSLSGSEFSDDGFDSEGSSETSDSDSDDDSNSDNEVDAEADRLWNSLCRPQDPYNLHHFTAPIATAPRPIPSTAAAAAALSSDSSPDSSLDPGPAPAGSLALSVSPPALQHPDSWDDSASASEAEDAEGLLNYFTSSSDPYSPWNFQAPVRSERPRPEVPQEEGRQETETPLKRPPPAHRGAAAASSPPRYRREEAEERLDSGFSEPPAVVTTRSCGVYKKVRFCEEVEEFITSSSEEEDRRGQWEELARDRWRFWRRCLEVEQSIAYCLQPEHRSLVYRLRQAPPAELSATTDHVNA